MDDCWIEILERVILLEIDSYNSVTREWCMPKTRNLYRYKEFRELLSLPIALQKLNKILSPSRSRVTIFPEFVFRLQLRLDSSVVPMCRQALINYAIREDEIFTPLDETDLIGAAQNGCIRITSSLAVPDDFHETLKSVALGNAFTYGQSNQIRLAQSIGLCHKDSYIPNDFSNLGCPIELCSSELVRGCFWKKDLDLEKFVTFSDSTRYRGAIIERAYVQDRADVLVALEQYDKIINLNYYGGGYDIFLLGVKRGVISPNSVATCILDRMLVTVCISSITLLQLLIELDTLNSGQVILRKPHYHTIAKIIIDANNHIEALLWIVSKGKITQEQIDSLYKPDLHINIRRVPKRDPFLI